MKTTLFLFCISLIIFSCSKDREIDKMGKGQNEFIGFCGTTLEMDTLSRCTASDNNLSGNSYWKYFTSEQIQHCNSVDPLVNPCISVLKFHDATKVSYTEGSDMIMIYSYKIEGDSVKLYLSDTIHHNSFYINPTCEQRIIGRNGGLWFQY